MSFQRQVTFNTGAPAPQSRAQKTGAGMQRTLTWALGLACTALGLVTMFANGMFALKFGSTNVETATMVVASVGIDVLKIGLLLPVANLWRHDKGKAMIGFCLWLACFSWSLFSAYGFAVSLRGDVSAHNAKAHEDRAAITERVGRSKAQLKALPTTRPASALRADIHTRELELGITATNADKCERNTNWALTYCGPIRQLKADLASAEAAARLEEAIRADQDRLASLPVVAARSDAQIDSLAAITGYAAQALTVITTIFFAALIEIASAIGPVIVATGARYTRDMPDEPLPVPETVPLTIDQPPMGSFEEGFSRWAGECITQDNSSKISGKEAYGNFTEWCRFNGPYAIGSPMTFGKVFGSYVTGLGAIKGRTGSIGPTWQGIAIRNRVTQLRLPSAAQ